jgi:hypothetical protein
MKAAHLGIEEVINLIKIAKNDLPAVEHKYQSIKRHLNSIDFRKMDECNTLHIISDRGLKKSAKIIARHRPRRRR